MLGPIGPIFVKMSGSPGKSKKFCIFNMDIFFEKGIPLKGVVLCMLPYELWFSPHKSTQIWYIYFYFDLDHFGFLSLWIFCFHSVQNVPRSAFGLFGIKGCHRGSSPRRWVDQSEVFSGTPKDMGPLEMISFPSRIRWPSNNSPVMKLEQVFQWQK